MQLVVGCVLSLLLGTDGPPAGEIRAAAERGLGLIEASTKAYPGQRECFSCHHQAVPVMALRLAQGRGFKVDQDNIRKQLELTCDDLESAIEDYRAGRGQGGGATRAGYALLTLGVGGWKPDETTEAVAGFLLGKDKDRGHWRTSSQRPPTEASPFTTTYVSLAGLRAFATPGQKEALAKRVEGTKAWLAKNEGADTEDRVFRLLAMKAVDSEGLRSAVDKLRSTQRDDGGWSQLDGKASDAYATGSALTALATAGGVPIHDPAYRRGLAYLLKTQQADGSWHVVSRSKPFQAYFESGFPHKADQFVSIAASAWAVSALILALPEEGPIEQTSGTKARLRGLSVVSPEVAWASGTDGTVLLTADAGQTWTKRPVPDSASLDFRDIHALDTRRAWALSIGEGDKSRIYATADGGATWTLQHQNRDPKVFLDAIAFWDDQHGLAMGDPVDGRYTILVTADGGQTWTRPPLEGMPPALENEGAFAASGTCLVVRGEKNAWFATGGAKVSRVFRSTDRGRTWTAHETPITAVTASAGVFSLAFRDPDHGVAVGGDYKAPERADSTLAFTSDGGRTWKPGAGLGGYRSAVAFIPGSSPPALVAVGPTGTDRSLDDGRTWTPWGKQGFHALGFAPQGPGWAVGEEGRIARLPIPRGARP